MTLSTRGQFLTTPMAQDAKASRAIEGSESEAAPTRNFLALMLGSIGVVYGDIGTSPLYAFRESALAATGHNAAAREEAILGILSLIIWALLLIVTVKYVVILLRADNNGEGGTLALMALASRALGGKSFTIILLGMISAALFYGDAMITPALSVLSAVEGLEVIAPAFDRFVVPLSVLILFALFAVQSRGTARIAAFFGPITLVWFVVLAIGGTWHIAQNLTVLAAFNPLHGVSFLFSHGYIGLLTLGAVFLVVTGVEALYAMSAGARSRWRGSRSACRHLPSIISARARYCLPRRRQLRTRSSCSTRNGRYCPWWSLLLPLPSSRAKR